MAWPATRTGIGTGGRRERAREREEVVAGASFFFSFCRLAKNDMYFLETVCCRLTKENDVSLFLLLVLAADLENKGHSFSH